MTVYDAAFVNTELSKPTSIFGLKLWVVIGIFVGAVIVVILFLLSLCITAARRRSTTKRHHRAGKISGAAELTPVVSKEIQEIVHDSHPDQRPVVPQVWYIYKYVLEILMCSSSSKICYLIGFLSFHAVCYMMIGKDWLILVVMNPPAEIFELILQVF